MSNEQSKFAMIVRVASLAPFVALVAVLLMYFCAVDVVTDPWQIAMVAACLTIMPVLAYPVQMMVPKLRAKGRDGQRTLAIIFSCVGYVVLTVLAFTVGFSPKLQVFALTYLFSGVVLLFCRLFGFRPSGHCCGVAGPILYLAVFVNPYFAFAALLLVPVVWSCVALKRHTALQCVVGCLVPAVSMLVAALIIM